MPLVLVGFEGGDGGALLLEVGDTATGRFNPVSSNKLVVFARTSVMNWAYEGVARGCVSAWVRAAFFNRVDASERMVASAVRSAMTARTL